MWSLWSLGLLEAMGGGGEAKSVFTHQQTHTYSYNFTEDDSKGRLHGSIDNGSNAPQHNVQPLWGIHPHDADKRGLRDLQS